MGWSLSPNERPEHETELDAFLLALGSAVFIAQAFERKCQYVCNLVQLLDYFKVNPSATFAEAVTQAAREKLLNPSLRALARLPDVDAAEVQKLDAGRQARNFIVHASADLGPLFSINEVELETAVVSLRSRVVDLAHADNLISQWIYVIGEREPAPRTMVDGYPHMVLAWVFRHQIERGAAVEGS